MFKIHMHPSPAWREQADEFVLAIDNSGDDPVHEELAAKSLGDGRYLICSIPFFMYQLSLGDEVATETRDGWKVVTSAKFGGKYTYRLLVDTTPRKELERLEEWAINAGSWIEKNPTNGMWAIAAPSLDIANSLIERLEKLDAQYGLQFESSLD